MFLLRGGAVPRRKVGKQTNWGAEAESGASSVSMRELKDGGLISLKRPKDRFMFCGRSRTQVARIDNSQRKALSLDLELTGARRIVAGVSKLFSLSV